MDTTALPDLTQRWGPIENIGLVVGTCGTAPYIHLQLETAQRFFGPGGIPILIVNDGDTNEFEADGLDALCKEYGASCLCLPHIGHAVGDLRAFQQGLEWAERNDIQLLAKFSRRFVPLEAWRHQLAYLSGKNQECAAFARYHNDRVGGMFRTDAVALRVGKWANDRVRNTFSEGIAQPTKNVVVESIVGSLANILGGWELWDLIGPVMSRPWHKAMQWRGVLPCMYGDLSRQLGLPYSDDDFAPIKPPTIEEVEVEGGVKVAGCLVMDKVDGQPAKPTLESLYRIRCARPGDINEHLPILRGLAGQCDHVTEFGVRGGCSTTAFLMAKPKRLVSYDLKITPTAEYLKESANGTDFILIEQDVLDARIEETDLLFIDTYHSFDQLEKELELHAGKARRFIALHDTETFGLKGEDGKEPGLTAAIEKFLSANSDSWRLRDRLTNNNGLTVLERMQG